MARKCPDCITELNGYLDGEVSPELCAEIEAHIGECRDCKIMVDTLRQTVKLCRDGREEPLSSALGDKLEALLKQRWKRKFGEE